MDSDFHACTHLKMCIHTQTISEEKKSHKNDRMGWNSFEVYEYRNTMFSVICSIALYIYPSLSPRKKEIKEIKCSSGTHGISAEDKNDCSYRGINIF